MHIAKSAAAIALSLSLCGIANAQYNDHANEKQRKADHAAAKVDEKANEEAAKLSHGKQKKAYKAQAKADHETHQALNDDQTKHAAREQDKANKKAKKAAESGTPVE